MFVKKAHDSVERNYNGFFGWLCRISDGFFRPRGTDSVTDSVAELFVLYLPKGKDGLCDGFRDLVSVAKDGKRTKHIWG